MAKKKENKAVGYIILSFIPLFGIVWAAVAGIQHNGYVKEAKAAEIKFEEKFLGIVNELEVVKENNIVCEKLNITSALPRFYETRLSADKVSTNNSSYTVTLSANPTFVTEDGSEVLDSFYLNYEFFINLDNYTKLTGNYQTDYVKSIGTSEYLFETYYPNNPKSSPVYVLDELVDEFSSNILMLEIDGISLVGVSSSSIIEMIDKLPENINYTKEEIDALNTKIKEIESELSLLPSDKHADVENLAELETAKSLYNSRNVEYMITLIGDKESYALSTNKKITDSRSFYDKLTDAEKANVSNLADLEFAEFEYPMWKVTYYVTGNKASNAAKFYNQLTLEQRNDYKADGLYEALLSVINTYNEGKEDKDKLTLVD